MEPRSVMSRILGSSVCEYAESLATTQGLRWSELSKSQKLEFFDEASEINTKYGFM
jgi:hypothetical protein